jgi:hypothetical protein
MSDPVDRFLRHRPTVNSRTPLGRVYGVTRQSWKLEDDPARVLPRRAVIAIGRSASEAAQIAREHAAALGRTGFHKPSGAWWGVEDGLFHRFVVAPRVHATPFMALAAGLLGVATFSLVRRRKRA